VTPKRKSRPAPVPVPQKGVAEIMRPPMVVGYLRISTDDQTTALQTDAMERARVDERHHEQASGSAARPVLRETIATLAAGDTLVVWRLDRLGRSLGDLIAIAAELRERGIFLRSLCEGFDTATASGRLLYNVLGAVAEFERESIIERTRAGMRAAKLRGQHVGRPRTLDGKRLEHARELLAGGERLVQVARLLRVSRSTIRRAIASSAG
jgi:DNA invertase Pin-like site-specific DNA recombinase